MPALCSSVSPLFRWAQHPCLLFFCPSFSSISLFFNIFPTLLLTRILPYKEGLWNWFSKPGNSPFLQSLQCCLSFLTFPGTRMAKIEPLLGSWMRRSRAGKDHIFGGGSEGSIHGDAGRIVGRLGTLYVWRLSSLHKHTITVGGRAWPSIHTSLTTDYHVIATCNEQQQTAALLYP